MHRHSCDACGIVQNGKGEYMSPLVRAIFSKTLMKILITIFAFLLFFTVIFLPISLKLFKSLRYFSGEYICFKNDLLHSETNLLKKIFFIFISVLYAPTVGLLLCLYAIVLGLVSYMTIFFRRNGSVLWGSLPLLFLPLFYDVKNKTIRLLVEI